MAAWKDGLPPLDRVKAEDFPAAFDWALTQRRTNVNRIASDGRPATFENTVAALDEAGLELADVRALYTWWGKSFRTPAFDAVEEKLEPVLARADTELYQSVSLFQRVSAIYQAREHEGLDAEQTALVMKTFRAFALNGAGLPAAAQKRLGAIDERLASIAATFNQHLGQANAEGGVLVTDPAELEGLTDDVRADAAKASAAKGHPKAFYLGTGFLDRQTVLAHAVRRSLREKVWRANRERSTSGHAGDNSALVHEMLALRAERAHLLGASSYAELKLADSMMKSPERALGWLRELARPVHLAARADLRALQAEADGLRKQEGLPPFPLEPWDVGFYAEKVRATRFAYDEAAVSAYLDPVRVKDALLWTASELFGIHLERLAHAPTSSADLEAYEVKDTAGQRIGFLYLDIYPRAGKQAGAWTDTVREPQGFSEQRWPVVLLSYNEPRPQHGKPAVFTWFEAVGMFHELGHGLQQLLTRVRYPSLAGDTVAQDTVEAPSQWMERYLGTAKVLARFTRHARTGAAMPPSLAARVQRAQLFGASFITSEMLQAAWLDLKLHQGNGKGDFDALEREVHTELDAPAQILPLSRPEQAGYLFGGDNYSAQFYSYLFSDELAAETYEAFLDGQGPFDTFVASRLREKVFAPGSSVDAAEAYRDFLGRDPTVEAFLQKRGLLDAVSSPSRPSHPPKK